MIRHSDGSMRILFNEDNGSTALLEPRKNLEQFIHQHRCQTK